MPAYRYVDENSSVAILATKRSADVTPEVNLREHCQVQIRLPTLNPEELSTEVQKLGISGPTKGTYVLQKFLKNEKTNIFDVSLSIIAQKCITLL